jgi:hypothetical protein
MDRNKALTGLEQNCQLIENYRAWTARAFCMATAELRGTFEPDQVAVRGQRRESRRAMVVRQLKDSGG